MKIVHIYERAGAFAENKDVARDIRINEIIPELTGGGVVVLDFSGVGAATQSFIHALLSDVVRTRGPGVLEQIEFKSCSLKVRKIIEIVTEYTQEGMGIESNGKAD